MGKYSKPSNLSRGGKITNLNNFGRPIYKNNNWYIAMVVLALILIIIGGLLYADYKGLVNLGLISDDKKKQN